MRKKGRIFALFLLLALCLVSFVLKYGYARQDNPQAIDKSTQAEEEKELEKIIPSPKNIKESTAIYVFLAWMWVAIFVLVYVLRQKIKEVDRLHKIKFFSFKKE